MFKMQQKNNNLFLTGRINQHSGRVESTTWGRSGAGGKHENDWLEIERPFEGPSRTLSTSYATKSGFELRRSFGRKREIEEGEKTT